MAGKGKKRLSIPGLIPGEDYVIQVRAVDDGEGSTWSEKHNVETIDDTAGGTRTPVKCVLNSWNINADGLFSASWNTVGTYTDGTKMVVNRYELELSSSIGTYLVAHYGTSGEVQTRDFVMAQIRAFFGGNVPSEITAKVRVISSAGVPGEYSDPLVVTIPTPYMPTMVPDPGEGVIDGIKVRWGLPAEPYVAGDPRWPAGYRVYVGTTADFVPDAAQRSNMIFQGDTLEALYTTMSYDTDHWFKVCSYSLANLQSDYISMGPFKPVSPYGPDDIAPEKPTLSFGEPALDRTTLDAPKANVIWTIDEDHENNKDISGFVVRWRLQGDTDRWRNSYFEKTARTGTIDLPQPFNNYEFQISAYDFVANYSPFAVSPTDDGPLLLIGASAPPGQVTGVTSIPRWDGLKILWDASTDSVKYNGYYEVQYNTTGTFADEVPNYTISSNEIDITNLSPLTEYFYRVRAVDSANQKGPWSVVGSVTLPSFPVAAASDGAAPASAPQNVKAAGGLNYVNVSWDRVQNNDAVWYEVFASTTDNFTTYNETTFVGESSGTSLMVTSLANGSPLAQDTPYYFKVRVMDIDCLQPGVTGPVSGQATATLTQVLSTDLGINMAGENLYYNSSFDTDSDGNGTADYWRVYNLSPTTEPHTATLVTGRDGFGKAQRISWTGVNTSTKGVYSYDASVLRPNTEYMLSFYARANGGTGFNLGFNQAPSVAPVWSENPVPHATNWQRYIVKFTTGATPDPANAFITIKGHSLDGGWLEIDDAQIEAGNTASAYKSGTVSIAKLASGRMSTAEMIIDAQGIVKSTDYNPTTRKGWAIHAGGIDIFKGKVDASQLVANTTITEKLFVGDLLEIASGGSIESANYRPAGTNGASDLGAGFRLDSAGFDFRSGTVAVGALSAGTITSPDIRIGGGGKFTIDANGSIVSSNYNGPNDSGANAGFKISNSGIEMWDTNSKINVAALETGTLTSAVITVGSGGELKSEGFRAAGTNGVGDLGEGYRLNQTGLTIYNGTIYGSAVQTNQLKSIKVDPVTGKYAFSLNADGYAELSGAWVRGNMRVSDAPENVIQSGNFSPGVGWQIRGDGLARFYNVETYGLKVYNGAVVGNNSGHFIKSESYSPNVTGWIIRGDGTTEFNGASFRLGSIHNSLIWMLDNGGQGQIRIYPAGDSSRFHSIINTGSSLKISGAWGGYVDINGYNQVVLSVNARVTNDMSIDRNLDVGNNLVVRGGYTLAGGGSIQGTPHFPGGLTAGGSTGLYGSTLRADDLGGSGRRDVYATGNGTLVIGASSQRYKTNIRALGVDPQTILALEPKKFKYRAALSSNQRFADIANLEDKGFIAEEANDLGLTEWVHFATVDGKSIPDSFDYNGFVVALQAVNRYQEERINDLEARLSALEAGS